MRGNLFIVFIIYINSVLVSAESNNHTDRQGQTSPQLLLDDTTDIWYWNDFEKSEIDNPTTPFIKENESEEQLDNPSQIDKDSK